MKQEGLTVVIPAYGDRNLVFRSVYSAASAYRGKSSKYKLEILIYADDIEYQEAHNGASQYDYFVTDEFLNLLTYKDLTEIKVIHNLEVYGEHIYQGGGRLEGLNNSKYKYVSLMDCDDVYSPSFIVEAMNIIEKEEDRCPIFRVGLGHLSFDENGYRKNVGHSIWVQSYIWNSEFIKKYGFTMDGIYTNKINRRQGEDYLMCQEMSYVFDHFRATEEDIAKGRVFDKAHNPLLWQEIQTNDGSPDALPNSFWFPNADSLSRQDIYYGQHLAGSTMNSSNTIIEFMEQFNKENGLVDKEDEAMKHRLLNMTIYSWFNLADFLKTVAWSYQIKQCNKDAPDYYTPKEEDWYLLRDNCAKLRVHFLKYYKEVQYSDIEDELYNVRHRSDARTCNVWFGTFYDYMNKPCKFFGMDYKEMVDYCHKLQFDNNAINCTDSQQYKAFIKRKTNA